MLRLIKLSMLASLLWPTYLVAEDNMEISSHKEWHVVYRPDTKVCSAFTVNQDGHTLSFTTIKKKVTAVAIRLDYETDLWPDQVSNVEVKVDRVAWTFSDASLSGLDIYYEMKSGGRTAEFFRDIRASYVFRLLNNGGFTRAKWSLHGAKAAMKDLGDCMKNIQGSS